MNGSRGRRWSIYSVGGFFLLLFAVLLVQGLMSSPESAFSADSGPECVSTTFGVHVSEDGYLEGVAATNCETGTDILLSYHLFDADDHLLSYEGIRFPSVTINGNQLGFFKIPVNSVAHYATDAVDIRFDWVRDGRYWFRDRYTFEREHEYRFNKPGTPLGAVSPMRPECRIRPLNFDDGATVTQFEQLTGVGAFRAAANCPLPENAYLTYHLLDRSGQVLQWDVANVQARLVCADSFDGDVMRIAQSVNLGETVFPLNQDDVVAAAKSIQSAVPPRCVTTTTEENATSEPLSAAVNNARIWSEGGGLARIVFDVIVADGSGGSSLQVTPVTMNIDARIDRLQTVMSLIPRILPANDYVLVPALIKVQRDGVTPTPFRLSMEAFDAAAGGRYETERTALSSNPDNIYQFHKITFRAPPEGIWNLNVGFVFDPYMWYSYIFPIDGDRVVFINPLAFMLLVLLSLFVLRGLLRFFKEERHWYGKVLTAGVMLGVIALFGVSAVLTIAGFSALMVYSMLKFSRSRHRFRDPWFYFLLMALAFGLLMEAFWSVHYADIYRHGVILSACLHAFVALLIVLIARKDLTRRIALAVWFAISGTLYLVVVSYLKFFGEPPRYSVYQYAGQAIDVADSALVLLSSREWLGIGLIAFSVVLVLVTKPDAGLKMMFARFRKG